MKYYIVYGSAGAYSDHTEWPVAVYSDQESANKHADKANERVKRLQFLGWNYSSIYDASGGDYQNGEVLKKQLNPYDADWRCDSYYSVSEVESGIDPLAPQDHGRAPKTGQCQDCCRVDDLRGHGQTAPGLMPVHLPFTEHSVRNKRQQSSDGNVYCTGGGKPPRSNNEDDYQGWLNAVKVDGGYYL